MNRVKKQHVVPRFYLEKFTNREGKIFAFDIQTLKSFETTVENVSHKKFFYDFEPIDEIVGDQAVEKALAHFESKSAGVITKILKLLEGGDLSEFTFADRKSLAEYIIIQQSRTLESRVRGEQLAKDAERQLKLKGMSDEAIKNAGLDAAGYNPKLQQLSALLDPKVEDFVNEFSDRYWVCWDNQTEHKFYSSDHPVVGHIHKEISFSAYEIYFPLTPRFAVSLLLKNEFPEWADRDNRIIQIANQGYVEFYNYLIITNCNRQVYCSENDFGLAVKIIKLNPDLSNPDRQRFVRV